MSNSSTFRNFAVLERNIKKLIEFDFPDIQVAELLNYDLDNDGDIVGVFKDQKGRAYHFFLEKDTTNPMLKRIQI